MAKSMVGKFRVGISPAVIVGALVNSKANYLTLGQCGGMSMDPPIIYISVNKVHYTNDGIKENGYFSVNIPSQNTVQKMDYVGLVSGRDVDKSSVFTAFYGATDKAPMIEECPVNMLCKVINVVELPHHMVFFGEIIETYVNEDCLTNGNPDMKKIDQVFLSGGKYCHVGNECGNAFSIGKALIENSS